MAQIITFGTMAARAVIRDVGRVMDLSYQETDRLAKLVPFELGMTLERALSLSTELRRTYEGDERVREVIDTAKKLEGMPRNASTPPPAYSSPASRWSTTCPCRPTTMWSPPSSPWARWKRWGF